MAKGDKALSWLAANAADLTRLSDRVWEFAEVGLQEVRSAEALVEYLRGLGFEVRTGVAGMPTAFVASWGKGKPVIGFLGEFDALPGLSQKAEAVKTPAKDGAPGHGCGHNLLGVAALSAAAAVKAEMEAAGIRGSVRYYGCPAEETLVGKVFMVKDGLFDDVDAVLDWHPGALNTVRNRSSNAMNSVKFTFFGRTAHAAGDPHHGRSALDAVELMNVGANYLREHVIEKARIHYVITDGGGEPNVVPARAEVWYYVRAPEREQVDEIYSRLQDIAKGAALMTGTTYELRFLAGCYNYLPNRTLNRLLHETVERVGPNEWTPGELEFARKISESFPPGQKEAGLRAMQAPPEVFAQVLHEGIMPWKDDESGGGGSSDVADVSWNTPTGRFAAATGVIGQPGHSWQVAACAGMSIGHKGMLMAAKILALGSLELLTDPELLRKARQEFAERTSERPYKSPIPDGVKPPLDQLPKH